MLLNLLRLDFLVQFRSGFWFAGLLVTLPWIIVLSFLTTEQASYVLPAIIFLDVAIIGSMFMAGVYFLEKSERSLMAIVVTPIKTWQWLASKVLCLAVLGTVASLALILVKSSSQVNWLYAITGCFSANVLFTLIGFAIVAPFERFTSFIVLYSFLFAILNLPSLVLFGLDSPLYWVLPSQPSLTMLRGTFDGMGLARFLICFCVQCVWIFVAFWFCLNQFRRFVSNRKGG